MLLQNQGKTVGYYLQYTTIYLKKNGIMDKILLLE